MRLCLLLAAAAGARARLAPRERERARLTGGRRLSDSNPGVSFEQLVKMTASDAALDDRFGRSVAVDGDTIVIGAYGDDDETGAVYVLRASDGEELAKLTAADAAPGDQFGWSVAIAGDTIVVGANTAGTGGAAYVFRTSDGGATYGQVAKLTVSDAAYDDNFGYSVAMDGDTVVVGAYSKNSGEGAVYVLRTTDGATYVEVAKLTASDAESGDQFGFSVAIDGHTIVVGTRGGGSRLHLPHERRRRHVHRDCQADGIRRRGVRLLRHLRGDRRQHCRGRGHRRRQLQGRSLRLPHDRRRRHVRPGGQADGRRRRGA